MGKSSGNGSLGQGEIQQIIEAQARANRIDQTTPTGSIEYSRGGRQATLTLSPQEQALLQQSQMARLMAGQAATERLGGLGSGREAVEGAYYDRILRLLRPEMDRREGQLRQRLANQGLPQSSLGFGNEIGRFEDARNQALEQAALAAVLAGDEEETRVAQMILSLLAAGQPGTVPALNVPQITVPVNQPGGGGGIPRGQAALGGAASGAATGASFGPWGAAIGGGAGGLLGLAAGG